MKSAVIGCVLVLFSFQVFSQSENGAIQVIEGGKVVVELIKALKGKGEKNGGCKQSHADICVLNESSGKLVVSLFQRSTGERRELVIQPRMRECSLQVPIGVWTYDLHTGDNTVSIRKGDLLIESCQNLTMNVKI